MSGLTRNWHEQVFFGIHYDLHAGVQDTELGRELTPEHLRERLLRVKPDWIQCDCKGHAGYTSWPTEVGSTSPGVVKDALRIHRDVTRELGIKLGMHYSGVWDSRAVALHPDWARVNADGSADGNMTCRLSAYDDELMIPQMLEVVTKYDVDGFWVDGENWASAPCWCERCREEFTRRTHLDSIPTAAREANWEAWLAFHRDLFVEHVTAYANAVHALKPECLICSNWMYTVRQPEPIVAPVDYLSGDYSHSWGADRAAAEGRVLDSRRRTWDLMAWGFTKTNGMEDSPPWVFKPASHLCQELSEVIALGGAGMIYDNPQRSGWLTGWHQDVMAEVAAWCRERQDDCFGTETFPQVAVLHLTSHYYSGNDPLYNLGSIHEPMEGALHALLESQLSTDILLEHDVPERLGEYRLAVVPEQTRLSPAVIGALEAFAARGGSVLLTGAHLAAECPELVGVEPLELAEGASAAAQAEPEGCCLAVAGKAVPVSGPWAPVTPTAGTEVWAFAMAEQDPEKDLTDRPAVTARRVGQGWIIAVHGPLFRNYFQGHYPLLRRFIGDLVSRLGVAWDVTVAGPAWLELVLRRRGGQTLINLINRGSGETLSGSRVIVEELPPVRDVVVRLRRGQAPASVRAVPEDPPVEWSFADGTVVIRLPEVAIHMVLVVE
jgi:hypothetical protein